MSEDDVVREVRAAREEYCQQFGHDLAAIVRDLREQERIGGRKVVRLSPRGGPDNSQVVRVAKRQEVVE